MGVVIEVVNQTTTVSEDEQVTHVVEVIRRHTPPTEVTHGAREIEVVRPGGTVVNVGVGPDLPDKGYEGQVWILV